MMTPLPSQKSGSKIASFLPPVNSTRPRGAQALLLIGCAALLLAGGACSKSHSPHTQITPDEGKEIASPDTILPLPPGPVAGSVWDVMKPGERIPKDVLQAMAGLGADTRFAQKLWQARLLDVDGDGAQELMISNVVEWCGSGGCGVWLWQRQRQGLRNLLPSDDILAVAVEVESTATNGYRDLRFYHRFSSEDNRPLLVSDLFSWDGTVYRYRSRRQHGEYLAAALPPSCWKVVP